MNDDHTQQEILKALQRLEEQGNKSLHLQQQTEKAAQRSGAKYPPNQINSPESPAAVEAKQKMLYGTSTRAIQDAKAVHEKAIAPVLGKAITEILMKQQTPEKEPEDSKPNNFIDSIKQALSPVTSILGKDTKNNSKPEPQHPAQKERRVVAKAQEMVITDISPKAKKGFGSIFSGLFKGGGLFGGKKEKPTGKQESSGGIFSTIAGLLGTTAMNFLPGMFTGAVLSPMLKSIGGGIMTVLKAPFKMLGWGLDKAVAGVKYGYDIVSKSPLGRWTGNLFSTIGSKLSTGMDIVAKSRLGQSVSSLFSTISTSLGNAGRFVGDKLMKLPGVSKLATAVSGSLTGVGGSIAGLAGRALRFAGPIGAAIGLGVSAFDGAKSAIEEYKNSGSLASAAKEGLASFASSLSFGLIDQETISSGMSKAGEMITSVSDTVVGGVKSLAGKAMNFLFGSPHASHYIGVASDQIHDGTVQLADSSLRIANASRLYTKANTENQDKLLESTKQITADTQRMTKTTGVNRLISGQAQQKILDATNAANKINKVNLNAGQDVISNTQKQSRTLTDRIKDAFSKFTPLGTITKAAGDTIKTYKTAVNRISAGESILTVLGDTLKTNTKTALTAMKSLLLTPVDALKTAGSYFAKVGSNALGTLKGFFTTDNNKTKQKPAASASISDNNKHDAAVIGKLSQLTGISREILAKTGKIPAPHVDIHEKTPHVDVKVDNKLPPPHVTVPTPHVTVNPTAEVVRESENNTQTIRELRNTTRDIQQNNIKLIKDVQPPPENSRISNIQPVIVDRTEASNRIDAIRDQQQQINTATSSKLEGQIESHLSKLVGLQEAQLQQAVNANQTAGAMNETIRNIQPTNNNVNVVNNSSTFSPNQIANTTIQQYRNDASHYNSEVQ